MAACGLQQIFDKPLPENPTLIETLSWNHIKSMTSLDKSSFTEIFGELHFKETSHSSSPASSSSSSSSSSASSLADLNSHSEPENSSKNYGAESKKSIPSSDPFPRNNLYKGCHRSSDSFSSMNSESLQLCTEGLGFESSFDVEDLKNEMKDVPQEHSNKKEKAMNHSCDIRRSRMRVGSIFPPPISCIGKSGKPGVCFKSFRQNGRFVLKEVRVPTQEFLQAYREDGRLKLQFIQPEDDIPEYEDEETDDMDDDDDEFAEEEEYEESGNNEEDKEDIGS